MNYAEQENWFPVRGGYCSLPDEWRDETVMYWRDGWDAPQAFRMDEQDALFDADGLYYFGGLTRLKMAVYEQFEAQDYRANEALEWVRDRQDRYPIAARNADAAVWNGPIANHWRGVPVLTGLPNI